MQALVTMIGIVIAINFFLSLGVENILLALLLIGCVSFVVVAIINLINNDDEKAKLQREHFRNQALKYKKELARKRTQLITKDDYGDIDDIKWRKEIAKFVNTKIGTVPREIAMSGEGEKKIIPGNEVADIIDQVAIEGQQEEQSLFEYSDDIDGIEYEHFCADILRKSGWYSDVSKASNDQGVDIIAEKNGVRVAIQCKKYSNPVGNKAVQEVIAGKHHYGADEAVVVTNSSFTRSAKQLAQSTDVILLHHSDLTGFDSIFGLSEKQERIDEYDRYSEEDEIWENHPY